MIRTFETETDEPIYNSQKDTGVQPAKVAEPVFIDGVEFTIDAPPVTASPERQQASDINSERTVIPTEILYNQVTDETTIVTDVPTVAPPVTPAIQPTKKISFIDNIVNRVYNLIFR